MSFTVIDPIPKSSATSHHKKEKEKNKPLLTIPR